jgi:CheY-like chemotaxis protein
VTQTAPSILLVDDDEDDIVLTRRAFERLRLGNPLQVVNDGEAAIRYMSGKAPYADRQKYPLPALILLDVKMPRKGGHEVLEWLKSEPKLKRIPVVMLTSSKDPSDVNKAYDLGVNSYLVKPLSFDGLNEIARTLNLYWIVTNERPDVAVR